MGQGSNSACVCCASCFFRFSTTHNFEKPNDKRALDLMDKCAKVLGCVQSPAGSSDSGSRHAAKPAQSKQECLVAAAAVLCLL